MAKLNLFNTILNRSTYDEENIFKSYFTDIDDKEVMIESKHIYAIDGKGLKIWI